MDTHALCSRHVPDLLIRLTHPAARYVKGPTSRSLTVRNLQLSVYGLPFSCIYMVLKDSGAHRDGGFMVGFDGLAWSVVALQVAL